MFRFTIRDLLWLMVVVAFGICWGLDRHQLAAHHKRVEDQQAQALLDSFETLEAGKKLWQEKLREALERPTP
jgi:hypothetical protein